MLRSFAALSNPQIILVKYKIALVYTHQVNPDVAEYIARFNIALSRCSDVKDIEAKFLFKENLLAEIADQVMNC